MFFFFFNEDFRYELENFRLNPKLDAECRRAKNQLKEFRNRFPLDSLNTLSPGEYVAENDRRRDDFYSWVSNKTRDVAGHLAWAKHKLGVIRLEGNTGATDLPEPFDFTKRPDQRQFTMAVKEGLIPFLRTRGHDCLPMTERAFGKPLLLKLLNLYYPEEFAGIARVGWIDRITDSFSLDYGLTVYERSQNVKKFFSAQESDCCRGEHLDSPAIRAFFDDYIGFSSDSKPYVAYLKEVEGLSGELSEKFARHGRSLSRLLLGYGLIKTSLFRSTGVDVRENGYTFLRDYANKADLSNQKIEDFRTVIDVYSSYYDKVFANEAQRVYIASPKYVPAGRATGHQVDRAHQRNKDKSNKRQPAGWNSRFSYATTSVDVARLLEDAAQERLYFRHYTTLTSFMYMTEDSDKWMFRLTRGDDPNMNDQLECRRLGDAQTWKRTFIGSFSCVEDESAAMWGLYGKPTNEALRLSFNRDAMQKWLDVLRNQKEHSPEAQFFGSNGNVDEKVRLRWSDIEFHFADVLYGGSVNQDEPSGGSYIFRKKRLKKSQFAGFGPEFERTAAITGFIKSIDWAYEEEARIIVRVNENVRLPTGKTATDIQYVFIPIPKDVLAMVEYMRGPCVPEKLRIVLSEQITRIIGPKALISDSKYKGNLKFK